jgi:hypothetical protein
MTLDTDGATNLGGNAQLTYGAANSSVFAHNANAATIGTAVDATTTLEANALECTDLVASGDTGTFVSTCTFNTNWGPASAVTCIATALTGTGTKTCTIAYTEATGVAGITIDFLEDNPGTSTILTKHTITQAVGAASAGVSTYVTYPYDSTDAFNIGAAAVSTAVTGATQAQFAAALLAETGTTIEVKGSLRTGALTTGVSSYTLG